MKARLTFSSALPTTVQLEVVNDTDAAQYLALDNFHNLRDDVFEFDVPVVYKPFVYKKRAYKRAETIRVPAGASVRTFLDLSRFYDLENATPAPTKAKYAALHPLYGFDENVEQLGLVTSEWVELA